MAMSKVLFGLLVLFMTTDAASKFCNKRSRELQECLDNGYQARIFSNCTSKGEKMKGKAKKACVKLEKKINKKCGSFECDSSGKRSFVYCLNLSTSYCHDI